MKAALYSLVAVVMGSSVAAFADEARVDFTKFRDGLRFAHLDPKAESIQYGVFKNLVRNEGGKITLYYVDSAGKWVSLTVGSTEELAKIRWEPGSNSERERLDIDYLDRNSVYLIRTKEGRWTEAKTVFELEGGLVVMRSTLDGIVSVINGKAAAGEFIRAFPRGQGDSKGLDVGQVVFFPAYRNSLEPRIDSDGFAFPGPVTLVCGRGVVSGTYSNSDLIKVKFNSRLKEYTQSKSPIFPGPRVRNEWMVETAFAREADCLTHILGMSFE